MNLTVPKKVFAESLGLFVYPLLQQLLNKKIWLFAILLILTSISCRNEFSIYKDPWKPVGIQFEGNCLVNRLSSELPIKKEDQIMSVVLKQLTKFEGVGFSYLKFLNADSVIQGRIEFVPQPDVMDRIFKDLHFKYLINVSVDANQYKKGTLAWRALTGDISHQVTAKIAVYETETSRLLYTQEVVLTEEWRTVTDDWGDEKRQKFVLTYSTETLMKKAVIKCARDLVRSTDRNEESESN